MNLVLATPNSRRNPATVIRRVSYASMSGVHGYVQAPAKTHGHVLLRVATPGHQRPTLVFG